MQVSGELLNQDAVQQVTCLGQGDIYAIRVCNKNNDFLCVATPNQDGYVAAKPRLPVARGSSPIPTASLSQWGRSDVLTFTSGAAWKML